MIISLIPSCMTLDRRNSKAGPLSATSSNHYHDLLLTPKLSINSSDLQIHLGHQRTWMGDFRTRTYLKEKDCCCAPSDAPRNYDIIQLIHIYLDPCSVQARCTIDDAVLSALHAAPSCLIPSSSRANVPRARKLEMGCNRSSFIKNGNS